MANITERNKQKVDLANIGFSMKYIDEWQPKTTLYRHKPTYNDTNEIEAVSASLVQDLMAQNSTFYNKIITEHQTLYDTLGVSFDDVAPNNIMVNEDFTDYLIIDISSLEKKAFKNNYSSNIVFL